MRQVENPKTTYMFTNKKTKQTCFIFHHLPSCISSCHFFKVKFKKWLYSLLYETTFSFVFIIFSTEILAVCSFHSWQPAIFWDQCMRWPPTTPLLKPLAAFLFPGVNSRAESVPSPGLTPETTLSVVGSRMIPYARLYSIVITLYICIAERF